jgi:hypothetical protein
MIFLTLVLRPAMARWSNIVLAILYVVSILAGRDRRGRVLLFLSAVEIAMLLLIVRYAWSWPRPRLNS